MDPGYNPQTVEEVFRDFKGRRAGIIRALTIGIPQMWRISSSNATPKSSEPKVKQSKPPPPQVKAEGRAPAEEGPATEEEDGGGGGANEGELGGACGESYGPEEFWIYCDICEKWFHGKCVKITAAKAEHTKQYKCPSWRQQQYKRARPS
ncbi:unnamed protein product [Urochloa humidicola]